MTDRLMTLLHGEADTLDVPPAPTGEILHRGRRLRRRRRATTWGAAALTVAVVAGGAALVAVGNRGHDHAVAPVTTPPVPAAWAAADTVYLGPDGRAVQMPEVAQSL